MNHAIKIQKAFILHSGVLLPLQNNILTIRRTKAIKRKNRNNPFKTILHGRWESINKSIKAQKRVCSEKSTSKKET